MIAAAYALRAHSWLPAVVQVVGSAFKGNGAAAILEPGSRRLIAVTLVCFGVSAFIIASFAGSVDPDHRGVTGLQLTLAYTGALALVAGVIALATSGPPNCRSYSNVAIVEDC